MILLAWVIHDGLGCTTNCIWADGGRRAPAAEQQPDRHHDEQDEEGDRMGSPLLWNDKEGVCHTPPKM